MQILFDIQHFQKTQECTRLWSQFCFHSHFLFLCNELPDAFGIGNFNANYKCGKCSKS